jgi:hypothetical protein
MLSIKFQFILLRGFRGEDSNVKNLQTDHDDDGPSDGNSSRCLWQGQLNSSVISGMICFRNY